MLQSFLNVFRNGLLRPAPRNPSIGSKSSRTRLQSAVRIFQLNLAMRSGANRGTQLSLFLFLFPFLSYFIFAKYERDDLAGFEYLHDAMSLDGDAGVAISYLFHIVKKQNLVQA